MPAGGCPNRRMCKGMTPQPHHRFYLPARGLAFEACWLPPRRSFGVKVRDGLRDVLIGGPRPGTPEAAVDPDAYTAALDLVDRQDLDAAATAFTDLGYRVSIEQMR